MAKRKKKHTHHREVCPTPYKGAFRDRIAAELFLSKSKRRNARDYDLKRAYPCKCGRWHLTSKR